MIIHDNRKEKIIDFCDIKCGETFYDPYEDTHAMKIKNCTDGDENAIDLSNGELFCYDDTDKVVPTKAKIEIYE